MARILITDDNRFVRTTITRYLKQLGHEVIEATNGMELVEKEAVHKPAMIFCDLLMPEYDGFYALEHIRSQGLDIPFVVLSADIQESSLARCRELGASKFVNKPFTREQIAEVVEELLNICPEET